MCANMEGCFLKVQKIFQVLQVVNQIDYEIGVQHVQENCRRWFGTSPQ